MCYNRQNNRFREYLFLCIALLVLPWLVSCKRVKRKTKHLVEKSKNIVIETKERVNKSLNPSAEQIFEAITGLNISYSIWNVRKRNTYFPHEGELSIVFYTTPSQVESWLQQSPSSSLWGEKRWITGEIPDSVFNCRFGYETGILITQSITNQEQNLSYNGNDTLIKLINNKYNSWISIE